MKKPNSIVISGTGRYVPEKILTNHDLAKFVDTSDEWIFERSGIKQRHIAAENETGSDKHSCIIKHLVGKSFA